MLEHAAVSSFGGYDGHIASIASGARAPMAGDTNVSQMRLPKHRTVFLAGDDADRLFEVLSGAVMVYRILDDGRRQVVEVVTAGGVCGLSVGGVYESCCETLVPSVLRSCKKSELVRSDALRMRVMEKLQAQVCAMHEHAVSLGRKTAEERVCTIILRLGMRNPEGTSGEDIILPLSRTEIADYLGLTLETVCRTLTDLQRRGFIEIGSKRSSIRILNMRKLRRAACVEECAQAA